MEVKYSEVSRHAMTIEKWHRTSLLMTTSLLLTTAGCAIIKPNKISKNCDELAIKLLSASHSKAAENGGQFIHSLITVNNPRKTPISAFMTTPEAAYYLDYYKGLVKEYSITPNGKISTVAYEGFAMRQDGEVDPSTTPRVITDEQIVCSYKSLFVTQKDQKSNQDLNMNQGDSITGTENKDGIRWVQDPDG